MAANPKLVAALKMLREMCRHSSMTVEIDGKDHGVQFGVDGQNLIIEISEYHEDKDPTVETFILGEDDENPTK